MNKWKCWKVEAYTLPPEGAFSNKKAAVEQAKRIRTKLNKDSNIRIIVFESLLPEEEL